QLGRMFAQAAQGMGYQVAVLEPSDDCPAGQVAQRLVNAGYGDAAGLDALAAQCLAVTTEFENVPADSLSRLAGSVFVA
ncbi:5-(carboxyamino)imidazole ribonucleotide synthase, partial [Bacillus sp. MBGLi97]